MLMKKTFSVASALAGVAALSVAFAAPSVAQGVMQDWYKACSKQGEADVCFTASSIVSGTGQPLTEIRLFEVKGPKNQKRISILVPTGRFIPAGVKLKVDDGKDLVVPYFFCNGPLCNAESDFNDTLINAMKKGTTLTVTSVNFRGVENPIEIPLKGFTQAFTGPGMREEDLRKEDEKLQKAIGEQAGAIEQRMRAEQEKARQAD